MCSRTNGKVAISNWSGVVAELPQVNERSLRFAFDVEQVYTEGAIVPKRISLAWYGDRGKDTETEPRQISLPHVNAGERWRLTVRLKRPHGSINPHGFDFEEWALERNIRATGYVRESDENVRLDDIGESPFLPDRAAAPGNSRAFHAQHCPAMRSWRFGRAGGRRSARHSG